MTKSRSDEPVVGERTVANRIYQADSRHLDTIEDEVVDLVICSPPYNVGKKYKDHNDALPLDQYLSLLRDVWLECRRASKDPQRRRPCRSLQRSSLPRGTSRQG